MGVVFGMYLVPNQHRAYVALLKFRKETRVVMYILSEGAPDGCPPFFTDYTDYKSVPQMVLMAARSDKPFYSFSGDEDRERFRSLLNDETTIGTSNYALHPW